MPFSGPILILDDDIDDHQLITEALLELRIANKPVFFMDGQDAINYLLNTSEQPFLILSDINMPGMNGLEFQKKIHENPLLKKKSIPFIFFSTSDSAYAISKAYDDAVQGFFQKPDSFEQLKDLLKIIMDYWRTCKHPNAGRFKG